MIRSAIECMPFVFCFLFCFIITTRYCTQYTKTPLLFCYSLLIVVTDVTAVIVTVLYLLFDIMKRIFKIELCGVSLSLCTGSIQSSKWQSAQCHEERKNPLRRTIDQSPFFSPAEVAVPQGQAPSHHHTTKSISSCHPLPCPSPVLSAPPLGSAR